MRVHVIIDSLEMGGAQNLLPGFVTAAQAAGVEVAVTELHEPAPAPVSLAATGVAPVATPVSSLLGGEARRRVRERVEDVKADLVHTHLGYADVLGGLAARSLGVPAVSTIHNIAWSSGSVRDRVKSRIYALARRYCAERVITVSEAVRERYLSHHWERPARVVTVHNGVPDRAAVGSGGAVRSELGIRENEVVLTMVSVLYREKAGFTPPPGAVTAAGHDIAAEAVASLIRDHPGVRLLVVGDGPERPAVERVMEPLGWRAMMLGQREDIPRILDASDVLIHPTRADAFPTVLLEAMSAGLPVIATRVGGIAEIIDEGTTGTIIEPPPHPDDLAAAARPLLANRDLRLAWGSAGRRRFEANFTIERWFQRLLTIYEAVVKDPEPTRATRMGRL